MKVGLIPENETERIAALQQFQILDTAPEQGFDDIVALASQICETPMAAITLIDEKRAWFKAKLGIDVSEIPRDISFSSHALHQNDIMIVTDTSKDERFCENPTVIAELSTRFFAGMPLITENGFTIGILSVCDFKPRTLNAKQLSGIRILAKQVITALNLRLKILEFKKTEGALRKSELQYRKLFDSANDSIIIFEPESEIILEANNKACKTYGFSRTEFVGMSFKTITKDKVRGEEQIKKVLEEQNLIDFETQHFTKDGKIIDVLANFSIIEYDRSKAVLIINRDITERKKAEKELLKAKELAEASLKAKDSFLANMSHEIRTPMNAIIGFSDLLSQTTLDENQQECVDSVKNAGENLFFIINDILDFSKIESGKLTIESNPFHLKQTVKSVYDLLRIKAKEKQLEYNFYIDKTLPDRISGDSLRLNQIMINLVGNAIKFTEKGSVTIFVKKMDEDSLNYKLKFSVKDTGIGIPPDKMDAVFERFTQANNDTVRKFGGTGLGLSIAKNLIELQGGEILVNSEEGKGSEFSFIIHYGKVNTPELHMPQKDMPGKKIFGKVLILLVEDNKLNQRLAEKVIHKFGFDVEIAENGKTGIEKLKSKKFDLVLMDLQMPEMDGYMATIAIRNELKLKTPIIAMTAHSLVGEKEKCLQLGMNDYIAKPFWQADLYDKIYNNLPRKKVKNKLQINEVRDRKTPKALVNLDYLKEISDGNTAFEKEMIELFILQMPLDIDLLQNAFNESDYSEIKSLSHKIKSSVYVIGASDLGRYLTAIGKDAANNSINAKTISKFALIKNRLENCYPLLEKILKKDYK